MHTLQPAPTLKDLRDRIDEAIAIAGANAPYRRKQARREGHNRQGDRESD